MTFSSNTPSSNNDNFSWIPIIAILSASFVYAIIRYSFFGPIGMEHWPSYITNKAISVFAVGLLALSAWNYAQGRKESSRQQGRLVWHAALIHSGLSLALLQADYYPAFFSTKGMNAMGELVILFGVIGTYALWQISHHSGINHHRFKQLACAFALLHLLPMSTSWFTIEGWYGFMPPLSLISAIFASTALLLYWRYRSE